MTVFQMHIEVNQRLQEVASYKRDKFDPEEIDLALNKAVFRLLERAVDSKFQETEIQLSHISALVHKNKILEVYIPASSAPQYELDILGGEHKSVYSLIPPDLFWLINARAEVLTDPVNCGTAPSLANSTITEYVAVVPFPALDTTPYFDNVTVVSTGVGIGTMYTSPTPIASGFTNPNSKYVVIQSIMETLYRKYPTVKVYWERFRDVYYQDSFIFVASVPIGTITITSGGQVSSVVSTLNNYSGYNRGAISALTNKTVKIASTKISQDQTIYDQLSNNRFYATRASQPLSVQTYDYITLYRDESFLITRCYIDYIRNPRTISLNLGQNCELAETAHQKVIDLAVELLRLDIKDQSYPATVQDTELRTN